ncbi:hypothetical protein [Streptomyces sp. NPDC059080]|uniref:hypothetical protein n=1 Tax=Streptomyces sp. NPDC059080 TaxID=3346718 RepID=UPI0036893C15
MGIDLAFVDSEAVIGEQGAWMDDKTEPCVRLDELFEKWYEIHGQFPYGALEFLSWLKRRGVPVEPPHWGDLRTDNTQNTITWLDEDFHYTVFKLGETYYVATSEARTVAHPEFFKITAPEPDDFLNFSSAWIECDAGHAYETEDTYRWQFYVEGVGPRGPKIQLHELDQDGDGDLLCPKCTNKIRKLGAL